MIKSIVSGFVALSVLAMPVAAEARGREDYRGERHERRHGVSTGGAIAIGLGAFILGSALNNRRDGRVYDDRDYDRAYDYEYLPRRECYEAVTTRYDRWGYPVYERVLRCY